MPPTSRTAGTGPADPASDDSPAAGGRRTVIAPSVVATVAGLAARSVRGVHELGGGPGTGGALDRVRSALPGSSESSDSGVQVEVGQVQAAFDLSLVAEDDVPLARLAGDVRERVINQVEELTGFEVTEVNIAVVDVYLDEEESS